MAEGVTYADLRFAKSPPEKSRPPGDAPREECSDGEGELTYENFPHTAPRPRQPPGPADPDPQLPGAVGGRTWSLVPLALLGACLFLLATCLGLGLRYWQVSRASQRHQAESNALAEQLGGQEENLTQTLQLLSQARAELSATRWALWQSWQDRNSTREQLEGELERWKLAQSSLQLEKAKVIRELEAAKRVLDRAASCQQMDCCPRWWKPFNQKCLWISTGGKTWGESKKECEQNEARLLIMEPWDAGSTWQAAAITSHLQSEQFWIGLTRKSGWTWEWHWVDGTLYTGNNKLGLHYGNCAKVSQGTLQKDYCSSSQRYVCEKAAVPFSWSIDPNT